MDRGRRIKGKGDAQTARRAWFASTITEDTPGPKRKHQNRSKYDAKGNRVDE